MTVRRITGLGLALLAAAAFAGLSAIPAGAANTRVSITDFKWSKEPQVDLGESVTWDWIGPDTMHSVTGQEPNATQWDSDPSISMPQHDLGDSYTLTFDQPGTYLFVCKMHSSVRGTVTVSGNPGNPASDPGPQPPLNLDFEFPFVDNVRLNTPVIGPKGNGALLLFDIDEPGTASVDYYRLVKQGKGKKAKTVRRFAGYTEDAVHVGQNEVRFANRTATFKPQKGNYIGYFRVDDKSSNSSPEVPVQFKINGKKSKKK
ncbi:MAG: hypothetical protein KDB48_08425 [Solirubrobacterales bacterium]|nr:hypothetical protein [Solirubrobacterales bacterium]HMT05559.1 plastocyanin/azurin family copper-binding protein [Solirubrobacterales bacterium]